MSNEEPRYILAILSILNKHKLWADNNSLHLTITRLCEVTLMELVRIH
jgi:hypothetical protein